MATHWQASVGVLLLLSTLAGGEEVVWRPVRTSSSAGAAKGLPGPPGSVMPAGGSGALFAPGTGGTVVLTSALDSTPSGLVLAQAPAPPAPAAPVPPVPPPNVPPPPPPPGPGLASPQEGYNCGVATGPTPAHPLLEGGRSVCECIRQCLGEVFHPNDGRSPFQSDHAFDTFISPVTYPFYFEDPRSLTEVRPIFIHEHTPGSTPFFSGGNVDYFGLQARLALTQRLSLVISELGWFWLDPHNPQGEFQRANGFSEFHLGPQYTFVRNEQTGTLLAGGLQFEIPSGPSRVFQSTGNLSLTPYASFGQYFGRTNLGAFHFLNTTGYEFGVDRERTDRFFSCFHLDYDVGNWHKIYPLVELNYTIYPFNGGERNLTFEGRDLINFGSEHVAGHNDLSIAVGARFKVVEAVQLGAAIEFPLLNRKDLMQYRLTFDLIFRY